MPIDIDLAYFWLNSFGKKCKEIINANGKQMERSAATLPVHESLPKDNFCFKFLNNSSINQSHSSYFINNFPVIF